MEKGFRRKITIACLVVTGGAVAIGVDAVCRWTPPWVISDLSMRFTHPELYGSRDGLPMYTALYGLRRRGLLRRGMSTEEIRKLLGAPGDEHDRSTDFEGHIFWHYGLHASNLTIKFSPQGEVLSFTTTRQGDSPEAADNEEVW